MLCRGIGNLPIFCIDRQKYNSPAKGVVPLPVARVRISSSAPRKKPVHRGGLFAWRKARAARNHGFPRVRARRRRSAYPNPFSLRQPKKARTQSAFGLSLFFLIASTVALSLSAAVCDRTRFYRRFCVSKYIFRHSNINQISTASQNLGFMSAVYIQSLYITPSPSARFSNGRISSSSAGIAARFPAAYSVSISRQ